MKLMLLIITMVLANTALALQGDGANPGDWKMMPISLTVKQNRQQMTIRNLDLFTKVCELRILHKGNKVNPDQILILRESREQSITLGQAFPIDAAFSDLDIRLACLQASIEESLSELVKFPDVACSISSPNCEQFCEATDRTAKECINDHLDVKFIRSTWSLAERGRVKITQGEFVQSTHESLSCIFLTTTKILGAAGDISYITAPSKPELLLKGIRTNIQWDFSDVEAGEGHWFDFTRPRITGVCVQGKQAVSPEDISACNPMKRAECNWVVAVDDLPEITR